MAQKRVMTGFLASVRTPHEAEIALQAGATLIDAKNPDEGALGALSPDLIRAIVKSVEGRAPVSATVGDGPLDDPEIHQRIALWDTLGLCYIKVGLFPPQSQSLSDALQALPKTPHSKRIAVILVDAMALHDLALDDLRAAGFDGVMLDTGVKAKGRLTDHVSHDVLQSFVDQARHLKLLVGLAGRLGLEDIAPLSALHPDYLGFRSALCHKGDRREPFDRAACLEVRALLAESTPVLYAE